MLEVQSVCLQDQEVCPHNLEECPHSLEVCHHNLAWEVCQGVCPHNPVWEVSPNNPQLDPESGVPALILIKCLHQFKLWMRIKKPTKVMEVILTPKIKVPLPHL
jgi:hypothetical protein